MYRPLVNILKHTRKHANTAARTSLAKRSANNFNVTPARKEAWSKKCRGHSMKKPCNERLLGKLAQRGSRVFCLSSGFCPCRLLARSELQAVFWSTHVSPTWSPKARCVPRLREHPAPTQGKNNANPKAYYITENQVNSFINASPMIEHISKLLLRAPLHGRIGIR